MSCRPSLILNTRQSSSSFGLNSMSGHQVASSARQLTKPALPSVAQTINPRNRPGARKVGLLPVGPDRTHIGAPASAWTPEGSGGSSINPTPSAITATMLSAKMMYMRSPMYPGTLAGEGEVAKGITGREWGSRGFNISN